VKVFQQIHSESFGDTDGVCVIADDLTIAAATEEEHDRILQQVMDKVICLNVRFNADKIHDMLSEGKYMGPAIKVTAVTQTPQPEDRKGRQRLLGMTRFLTQYILR
jgi:hypothetical protein